MNRSFSLTINGREVHAEVEPRLQLADFLRERQNLTGTHIGCEHGVCGACTVLIDGAPARSCILFAVACDGADITTIEGLENDEVITELREAFSDNHALQCGYCTPGMLITARDIVTRLHHADEERIRLELSGNLCRCTGYVGIVAAVRSVLALQEEKGRPQVACRDRFGPVGANAATAGEPSILPSGQRTVAHEVARAAPIEQNLKFDDWTTVETEGIELRQSFCVPHDRPAVWQLFQDLDQVAQCMPGARLTKQPSAGRAEGEVSVKLGPFVNAFSGFVDIERNDQEFFGVARGAGRDARSGTVARCIISYKVASPDAATSLVEISVRLLLSGPLAQFSRTGLLKDIAEHLTRTFARNLEARLSGYEARPDDRATLNAAAVARGALWARIKAVIRKITRRS